MPVLMAFSQKNKLVQKRNQKNQILKQKKRKEKYTVIQEKDKLASRKKQNRKKKLYGIIIKNTMKQSRFATVASTGLSTTHES